MGGHLALGRPWHASGLPGPLGLLGPGLLALACQAPAAGLVQQMKTGYIRGNGNVPAHLQTQGPGRMRLRPSKGPADEGRSMFVGPPLAFWGSGLHSLAPGGNKM